MPKSIGKPWVPEKVMYPILLCLTAAIIVCGLIVGVAAQFVCFILQPSTIVPSLKEAWENLIEVFHDLRN
jgi:hypothetical protein